MEKNTKILLGLGAVIAAYLIFKPKVAVVTTINTTTQTTKKVCPEGQELVSMTCIMAPCPDVCMPSIVQEKIKAAVMPIDWDIKNQLTTTSF
jgi:hypothetical protein